jgi:hypothetical protein
MEVADRFFNEKRPQIGNGTRSYGWLEPHIDCLFCSDTFTSKQALYHILGYYEQADPDARFDLDVFFQSDWARRSAVARWNLLPDFDQVVDDQECLQSEQEHPDVASCCAYESPGAFQFLIRQGIIRPCYYNSFGHSLFFLAFQANAIETTKYMISAMSPIHLIAPASVAEMWDGRSILQLAATNAVVFCICWEKVDQMQLDLEGILQEDELRSICRFASMGLASRLYQRGINLADVVKKDSSLWLDMIRYHSELTSLFDWLWMNNCLPPQDFLLFHPDPDSVLDWLLANNFPFPYAGHGQQFLREFAIHCGRLDAAHWLSFDMVAT